MFISAPLIFLALSIVMMLSITHFLLNKSYITKIVFLGNINHLAYAINEFRLWTKRLLSGLYSLERLLLKNWNSYKESGFSGLYFGGIAFKYLEQPKDLPETIRTAKGIVDVITTSGEGTGKSADINKIKTIYDNNVYGLPIAIASGISTSNVSNYLPYVDIFLYPRKLVKVMMNSMKNKSLSYLI